MPISELNSRSAVLQAIDEFDRVGRDTFLAKYGYSAALKYRLRYKGKLYDSKAIAGVAWGLQLHNDGKRRPDSYQGGAQSSVPTLTKLNFEVIAEADPKLPNLRPGTVYSWQAVATKFGFKPRLFSIGGGMLSCPSLNALLLITSSDESQSFSYGDKWDKKGDLIYAGKGLTGHQQLNGVNRFVAENSRELFLFEYAGSEALLFHGRVTCAGHWESIAPDKEGEERRVYQFRLRLLEGKRARQRSRQKGDRDAESSHRDASSFRPRAFDPGRKPAERRRSTPGDPESQRVLQEKADQHHQSILRAFGLWLEESGWTKLEEVDGATDLMAKTPGAKRRQVLFEIKSMRPKSERGAVRSGLAQLLEYRVFLGSPQDQLCLVTNLPITTRRLQLLDSLDIGHAYVERGKVQISRTAASQAIFG